MFQSSKKIKYLYDGPILHDTKKFKTWSSINYAMKMKTKNEWIEIHVNSP
jgi:hypothetical protein